LKIGCNFSGIVNLAFKQIGDGDEVNTYAAKAKKSKTILYAAMCRNEHMSRQAHHYRLSVHST